MRQLTGDRENQIEARLSAILACPSVGIALMDPEGRIFESNFAFREMLGPGGEIEQEWRRLQADLARRREEFGQAETRYLRRDGQTAWVRLNVSLRRDGHDEPAFSINLLENITRHRRAEEALKQSRERFRLLYDKAPLGYQSLDEGGHVVEVNQTWLDILGYAREEVIGRWVGNFLPSSSHGLFEGIFATLKTQGEIKDVELDMVRRDGSRLTVSLNGKIAFDEQGAIQQGHCVFTDISARKKAEEERGKWEKILSSTFNASHDLIMVLDRDLHVVMSNWRGRENVPEQERSGEIHCYAYFRQRSTPCEPCPVKEVFNSGRSATLECTDPASGKTREIRAFPILDEANRVVLAVAQVRDITAKRQTEVELLKVEKLSSLAILAGGIAHDFNNILTGVLGNISLAMLTLKEGESAAAPRLEEAEQATLRARDLVQQLLTFAKGGAPVKELASLADIIRDSATFTCRGSQVRAEFDLAEDLWPAEVDTSQISQVVQNLIINAVQAMPSGGTVRVRGENVTLAAQNALPLDPGSYIKISVQDYGIGIPAEHLAKIFDPFFSTKQKGSGLGLATAYSIIANHDGYMTVESALGQGTTFYLYLPGSQREMRSRRKSAPELLSGRGRILVMDDDDTVRDVAGKILVHLGYEPGFARDGKEALAAYTRARSAGQPFDAVIMDLTIPGGMGGKEAIQQLRQIEPEARAIVSSGYADDPIMTHYNKYGFNGVIKKPYRVNAFSRELARVLTRD
jgi:PAS domain S-box-containing protein